MKFKKGVTFDEMTEVINARIQLMGAQRHLWIARASGATSWSVSWAEGAVCRSLDRLWEAQQRAA